MMSSKNIARQIRKSAKDATVKYFFKQLTLQNIPLPVTEHKFHPTRKWRFDYCWVQHKIALEVEGGVFTGGRHTRGSGFMGDMEKYNNGALLGYRIIRTTPSLLLSKENIDLIKQMICQNIHTQI